MTVASGDYNPVDGADNPTSGAALEPFLLLAKSAKGAAAQQLVQQAIAAANTYVFGELLENQNIKDLQNSDAGKPYWNLLQNFAFGTYRDYLRDKTSLPELTDVMVNKLRRLSIASLASQYKCISYGALMEELDLKNVRDLEDLVIEAIYAGMIRGKLDQRKQMLVVDYVMGRDIKDDDAAEMTKLLQDWASTSQCLIVSLDQQMQKADKMRRDNVQEKQELEEEFSSLKKSVKHGHGGGGGSAHSSTDMEIIPPDVGSSDDRKKEKRSLRGLRGSQPTKVWRNQ